MSLQLDEGGQLQCVVGRGAREIPRDVPRRRLLRRCDFEYAIVLGEVLAKLRKNSG